MLDHDWPVQAQGLITHGMCRDGLGVSAEDVHSLGSDIFDMGFSWRETVSATCVEEAPGKQDIATFDERVVADNERLPAHQPHAIPYGSLACSHTNMFLRCLLASAESTVDSMFEDGRLSLEEVARRDSAFAQAERDGLE